MHAKLKLSDYSFNGLDNYWREKNTKYVVIFVIFLFSNEPDIIVVFFLLLK